VKASVDLSKISEPGEYTFKINAESPYGNAVTVSPSTVTLYIDQYTTRSLPVTADPSGSVADGYYASDPVFEPDTVMVSGAASDVNLADRAICTIDLTGLTGWTKKSMEVTVLGSDDQALDAGLFKEGLPSVILGMDILPVKTVPVDVASAIIGQDGLAPGYEIKDIECDPATVRIIGTAEALAGVTSIPLVPYIVSGASSDVVVPLAYQPPEGITVLDTEYAQVTVTIREKTASQTFKGVGIDVRNLGRGLTAQLSQSEVDVTVLAGVSAMSTLRASDVVPYIDLNGMKEGTYTVNILFELPDGFASENFAPNVTTITVTISRG
jgi:YbbR domain-containing protein